MTLKKCLTKSFQVKQRDNSNNCSRGTQEKAPSLHFPQKALLVALV